MMILDVSGCQVHFGATLLRLEGANKCKAKTLCSETQSRNQLQVVTLKQHSVTLKQAAV
jgi:hypothetical protein